MDHPFGVINEIKGFLRTLRSVQYDVVIDLQGLFKSGVLVGLSKGKRKIGPSGGREGSWLFLSERPFTVDYDEHAVDRYLKAAEFLGCDLHSQEGKIPVSAEDEAEVDSILRKNGLGEERLVCINPMARWRTKLWETERFARLADRIKSGFSCDLVFTGGADDRETVDRILSVMKHQGTNLAGRTSLKALASLFGRSRLLVTTDTGPMHIAAIMGCPVVALFGPTAPWRTGPYGDIHTVIQVPVDCAPCFKKKCDHRSCMKEITVSAVFEKVKPYLDGNI
jgi:3-deoxy-D-manno-octulosonic-acid transferase/heptosyltransferase-1